MSDRASCPSVVRPVLQPELTQQPTSQTSVWPLGGRAMAAGDVTVAGRAPSALTISFGDRPGRAQLWHPGEQIVVEHHVRHPAQPTTRLAASASTGCYRHHSFGMEVLRRDELVGSLVGDAQRRAYVAQAQTLLRQQPRGLPYLSRSTGLSQARLLAQLLGLLEVSGDLIG